MQKKIVGFKLIKQYPKSPPLGTELKDYMRFWNTDTWGGITKEELLCLYKEFWEPIYEQEGVNLNDILVRKEIYEWNACSYRDVVVNAMKEACIQTLDLVKKHIRNNRVADSVHINDKDIDNILTMIK